jgi:hypothetical protein
MALAWPEMGRAIAPVRGHAAGLRLAHDAEGKDLLPTPEEVEESRRRREIPRR